MAQLLNGNEMVIPTKADSVLAKESSQRLAAHLGDASGLRLEVKTATMSEAPSSFQLPCFGYSSVS